METLHTEKYFLQTFELDRFSRMPLSILTSLLQLAAENHAEKLGFGVEGLQREKLTWMLLRLSIRRSQIPTGRQPLKIETWPSGFDARFAYREFRLYTEDCAVPAAVADSHWMMVDTRTGRPVRLQDRFTEKHLNPRGREAGLKFPSITPGDTAPVSEQDFRIRCSDIDVNNHVNNLHYVNWIQETVPEHYLRSGTINSLDIEYRQGAVFGDTVLVRTFAGDREDTMIHTLSRKSDDTLLVKARTEWSI